MYVGDAYARARALWCDGDHACRGNGGETPSEERNERTREETKEREVRLLLRGLSRRLSATTRGVNTTIVVIIRPSLSLFPSSFCLSLPLLPLSFPLTCCGAPPIQSFSCAPHEDRTSQQRDARYFIQYPWRNYHVFYKQPEHDRIREILKRKILAKGGRRYRLFRFWINRIVDFDRRQVSTVSSHHDRKLLPAREWSREGTFRNYREVIVTIELLG